MALEPGDVLWYWNGLTSQGANIPQAEWFPGFQGPTDYLGHGEEISQYVIYDGEIAHGQPHMRNHPGTFAWLDNNPGNLTGVSGGPDYGQFPGKFNWHNFLIFPSWDAGFAAIASFLTGPRYVDLSLTDAIALYAPASDGNDPVRYAEDVAAAAGVPVTTTIGELDGDQMLVLQNKIAEIEGAVAGDTYAYDSPELPAEVVALLA